jgi:membrane associated rhomboid family serine protease
MSAGQALRTARERPGFALAVGASLVWILMSPLPRGVIDALNWNRAAFGDGQLWRLVTFPLVHSTPGEAFAVVLGTWVGWGVWRKTLSEWCPLATSVAITVASGIALWLDPNVRGPLAGASPLLHGWLAALVAGDVLRGRRESLLLALGLVVKIALERVRPEVLGHADVAMAAEWARAHAWAAMAGVAIAAFTARLQSRR